MIGDGQLFLKRVGMKKIVIASDSFKGSVSSLEVAQSAELAIRRVFPDCEVVKIPVADGGEGTVRTLVSAMDGILVSCQVHNPLMHVIEAEYGISGDGKTAILEMASASGLTLVPAEKRNPMVTTTFGTGEIIRDALDRGCRHFLVGIGGSATNDAGTGMLQALGFRFLGASGETLGLGGEILSRICAMDTSEVSPQVKEATFTVACDVNNPLAGENGAAFVYARQKGADDAMIRQLDEGLRNFAEVIRITERKDISDIPGAGAAGGLGGGFLAFLNAKLQPGIRMVLDALHFEERIRGADLIITGEGKLDCQTGMGKVPSGVLQAARKQSIPVIAIGGAVEDGTSLNAAGFLAALPIQSAPVSLDEAMKPEVACRNIQYTLEQLLRIIQFYHLTK